MGMVVARLPRLGLGQRHDCNWKQTRQFAGSLLEAVTDEPTQSNARKRNEGFPSQLHHRPATGPVRTPDARPVKLPRESFGPGSRHLVRSRLVHARQEFRRPAAHLAGGGPATPQAPILSPERSEAHARQAGSSPGVRPGRRWLQGCLQLQSCNPVSRTHQSVHGRLVGEAAGAIPSPPCRPWPVGICSWLVAAQVLSARSCLALGLFV